MMDVAAGTPAATASSELPPETGPDADRASRIRGLWQLAALLLAAVVAPSMTWVLLDQTVWPYDQAWYGQVSIELFASAMRNPFNWEFGMLHAFGIKAPGIAWFGQIFVPFGAVVGSVEDALLVYVLLTQLTTLVLLYLALRNLVVSRNRNAVALTCCLFVASTPVFVGMTHEYFVEPLQTLAVAWFTLIMAFANQWTRRVVLVQLVAAAGLAMLAKVSSPLYCVAPATVALGVAFLHRQCPPVKRPIRAARLLVLAEIATALLTLATMAWYAVNFSTIVQFTLSTSSGAVAADYGSADTFVHKLVFWLEAGRQSFVLPPVLIVLALVAGAGIVRFGPGLRRKPVFTRLDLAAGMALVEIGLVLATFSLQVNEETRYLEPATPFIAVVLAWALARLDFLRITQGVALVLAIQLGFVYRQAFALAPPSELLTAWVVPVHTQSEDRRDVEAVVALTCGAADVNRYNIVGVELSWFNANSLSFFAAKRLLVGDGPCFYTSLGYAESDADRAWNRVLAFKTDHFLTVNFASQPVPSDAFNRTSVAVYQRLQGSGMFVLEPLPDHPRVVVFKSVDSQ